MDEPSRQFVIFSLFGAAALALGDVCGRRGWVRDETSRPIHHFTVLAIWPVAHFFGVWQLEPQWENLWLLVFQPLLVLGPALAVVPLGRWAGLPRSQVGVVAVSAGLGNLGVTLGA